MTDTSQQQDQAATYQEAVAVNTPAALAETAVRTSTHRTASVSQTKITVQMRFVPRTTRPSEHDVQTT
jgi:hypothetical protein